MFLSFFFIYGAFSMDLWFASRCVCAGEIAIEWKIGKDDKCVDTLIICHWLKKIGSLITVVEGWIILLNIYFTNDQENYNVK